MKSRGLLLFSFVLSVVLIGLVVFYDVVPLSVGLILFILLVISHGLLFYRLYALLHDIERVNETLESIASGVRGMRIYTSSQKTKLLNANVNRLAKQMEKMAMKNLEDEMMIGLLTGYITSPIIYVDIDGRIRYVNDQFIKKFQARVKKNDWYELISNKTVYRFIDEAFTKELSHSETIEVNNRYYYANAVTIKDFKERFAGILFIFTDVTELKRFEKMQREFLADASHELKTPLSVIKGATEILLDRPHDPETAREFLRMIHEENERMEKIVQDILLISKLESDINLNFQMFDVKRLIDDTVNEVKLQVKAKSQHLHVDVEEGLTLYGDEEQLKHALINLLVNAVNYTERGKNISIRAWSNAMHVYIEIKDQGIGISEEDLPHIFKRFYRVDKDRSRQTGGTGLGLSIVKSVVDAHGGQIAVKSKPHEGTTFTLVFERLPQQQKN